MLYDVDDEGYANNWHKFDNRAYRYYGANSFEVSIRVHVGSGLLKQNADAYSLLKLQDQDGWDCNKTHYDIGGL